MECAREKLLWVPNWMPFTITTYVCTVVHTLACHNVIVGKSLYMNMLMLTCICTCTYVRHFVIARVLTFYMNYICKSPKISISAYISCQLRLCGCMPIVKFLQKSLWVPGPPGPGLPHPMISCALTSFS